MTVSAVAFARIQQRVAQRFRQQVFGVLVHCLRRVLQLRLQRFRLPRSGPLCKHNISYLIRDDLMTILYNRIAVFRAERGVSRRELAETVGVNNQTIGYLERGDYKPSLELAMKIAAYFGVPIELLFSFRPFESVADTLRRAAAAGDQTP